MAPSFATHDFWWEILYAKNWWGIILLLLLRMIFLCLYFFSYSTTVCLGVDFFVCVFILFGVHSASWIHRFMSFEKFGSFQSLFLCMLFNFTHFLISFWDSSDMNGRSSVTVSGILEVLSLSFCIYLSSIFPPFCCWAYSLSFFICLLWLLYFTVVQIPFSFSLYFLFWVDTLLLRIYIYFLYV